METTTTTKPPRQRRYTDEQQTDALAALTANAGDIARTARESGIPESTLRHWANGDARPAPPLLAAEKKAALASRFEDLANSLLEQAESKVESMTGRDAVIAAAVCVDKVALLRGESPGAGANVTVNVNTLSVTLTPADIQAARALLERAGPVRTLTPATLPPTQPVEPAGVDPESVPDQRE